MTNQSQTNYEVFHEGKVPVKAWVKGVPLEEGARQQLLNVSRLPFIHKWVAAMPDVHWGRGATIGSVIPTDKAIIPAAVGVDLGCGMTACRLSLTADDLPDNLAQIRDHIERQVPHGRSKRGGKNDKGSWGTPPPRVAKVWTDHLAGRFDDIVDKHRSVGKSNHLIHLGTLGTGNHFIELCLDEADRVWVMLHSGSRGVGNRIGTYFIEKAKQEMLRWHVSLPDRDLAYLAEGSTLFDDYVEAVQWAQDFARMNRELILQGVLAGLKKSGQLRPFTSDAEVVSCHHNYVARENHFGKNVWVTRKGAVRAREGDLGIIPGSMGAKSYIVRGKGNVDSFHSCSHGAGRTMSRAEAKRRFTLADHRAATEGVECRKDKDVIDETPAAYKDIDAVMAAQTDLVEVVHTLRQVVCVKG